MLSLANAFRRDALRAWHERAMPPGRRASVRGFTVEPKIDGLAIALHLRATGG